ncbi:MAG: aminodeoxychorismate synthase component I [Steroidobacteraceae bacterium]
MLAADPLVSAAYSGAWPLGKLTAQDLLALQTLNTSRYPVLLESAAASRLGRNHDILMAFPGERLSLHAEQGLAVPPSLRSSPSSTFLSTLDQWWQQLRVAEQPHRLPFNGGWFLYLGYELAAQIEPGLKGMQPEGLTAQAVRMPAAIVRCSDTGESWFVTEPEAEACLPLLQADLTKLHTAVSEADNFPALEIYEEAAHIFVEAVETALQHIAAGDIYQANLSRGWQAQLQSRSSPQAIYRALRAANPAPFAGLALLDDAHAIISSSPERLIELCGGWASTRPIAGTRPRHADPLADQALVNELQAHPKERAEHIMLLDLERNDLGRICMGGSVEVNEYMSIESYAHVHHIVSNVRGRLRESVTPGEVIAAVFPGGTITGCPKVRCMEIIAELEHTARGAYTGSIGYLNRDGSMDLNILIRTLELQGNKLQFRAGAGIVADSLPERELAETRAKALGLLRALQS